VKTLSRRIFAAKAARSEPDGGFVAHRVLDVAMTQVVLNQSGIRALVGQREAARVTEHVRVRMDRETSGLAVPGEQKVDTRAVHGLALLAHEEGSTARSHRRPFLQPGGDLLILTS
jgi:hypothetical protein